MAKAKEKFRKDYTHVAFVLDRSGSMSTCVKETIELTNQFVSDQKKLDPEKYPCTFTLAQFDDVYELVHDFKDIQTIPLLDTKTYVPRNTTALIDAMVDTIEMTSINIKGMKPEDRPEKVVIVVQTDGFENASHKHKKEHLSKLIEEFKKKGWELLFLAANLDSIFSAATKDAVYVGYSGISGASGMAGYSGMRGYSGTGQYASNNVSNFRTGLSETVMFSASQLDALSTAETKEIDPTLSNV